MKKHYLAYPYHLLIATLLFTAGLLPSCNPNVDDNKESEHPIEPTQSSPKQTTEVDPGTETRILIEQAKKAAEQVAGSRIAQVLILMDAMRRADKLFNFEDEEDTRVPEHKRDSFNKQIEALKREVPAITSKENAKKKLAEMTKLKASHPDNQALCFLEARARSVLALTEVVELYIEAVQVFANLILEIRARKQSEAGDLLNEIQEIYRKAEVVANEGKGIEIPEPPADLIAPEFRGILSGDQKSKSDVARGIDTYLNAIRTLKEDMEEEKEELDYRQFLKDLALKQK